MKRSVKGPSAVNPAFFTVRAHGEQRTMSTHHTHTTTRYRLAHSLAVVLFGTAVAFVVAVTATGCVHDVDDGGGDGAFFVAEGDDLLNQLENDDEAGWMHTHAIPVDVPFSRI